MRLAFSASSAPGHLLFQFLVFAPQFLHQPVEAQMRLDSAHHLLALERLENVVHRAGVKAAHDGRGLVPGRDEEDGNLPRGGIFLQLAADGVAVASRHHDVEQDHVRQRAARHFQAVLRAGRGEDLVAERFERLGEQRDVRRRIVDDEDLTVIHARFLRVAAGSPDTGICARSF